MTINPSSLRRIVASGSVYGGRGYLVEANRMAFREAFRPLPRAMGAQEVCEQAPCLVKLEKLRWSLKDGEPEHFPQTPEA